MYHTFLNSSAADFISDDGSKFCKKFIRYCSLFLQVVTHFVKLTDKGKHTSSIRKILHIKLIYYTYIPLHI